MNRFLFIFAGIIIAAPLEVGFGSQSDAASQRVELLWPNGAPGAKGDAEGDKPTLTIYLPAESTATGTGVMICPGGGYQWLAVDTAHKAAQWLNKLGIAAFVLKYRHSGTGYTHPVPLQDAQRAIRMVRSRAKEWGLDSGRIGVMGFSAGGHLAATVGTHFHRGKKDSPDPVEQVSSRPDFMILVYPLITLTRPYTHERAKRNLLGEKPDPKLMEELSCEKQVKVSTPPAFIVHGSDDVDVPVENSVLFYLALQKSGVPAEMHIYQNGPHGFALGRGRGAVGPVTQWTDRLTDWMKHRGLLDKRK